MNNIIFHIDVNSAFLSWEAVYRLAHRGELLDLRELPSAVGGDITLRHGIILAKSIPAGKYGIQTGESIPEAMRKCPKLLLVPPNYSLYEECSAAFLKILRDYSDTVEQYSIDEAFVDMSTSCHLFGTPEETTSLIKNRIREELGFTVNIGISEHKVLAKMASDFRKPDLVHTLYQKEIREKLWPLPVSELFFVGHATAKKLFSMGIKSIGALAATDPTWLKAVLKKQGEIIWGFANGLDLSPVLAQPAPNKGYGNSTTTPFDIADAETAGRVLLALSETLGKRLRSDNAKIQVVSVTIRYTDFSCFSHQKVLDTPTDVTLEIYHAARELFAELWNGRFIRHLGVHTGRARQDIPGRQMNLFDEIDYERLTVLDRTVDFLRKRFGSDAVKRAAFLNQPIDHMCGGIPKVTPLCREAPTKPQSSAAGSLQVTESPLKKQCRF
ncbi:DNA polymerase IV [Acetatifactor muris]|uniref:DNA polymerase IV n=1 Tax=Acetatifactor muris TaxID=879566 RepID=A0A2K4ZC39_9FIRM|nr:DNA polymerase IV [Acetatifactor muris]MCR2046396.1 DNA polymerase IV [Acetatifactor muris]SOY28035.1 DNA polymerase IV [Acetatifactor muris]